MPFVVYSCFRRHGRAYSAEPAPVVLGDSNSVIVRVHSASINPFDHRIPALFRRGQGVGIDLAGVVTAVSPDVTAFAVGDRVCGNTTGAFADHAVCRATQLTKLPESFSFHQGAALPCAYLTAYQGLVNHGFQAGYKVLVIGASGGCGSAAVQLAKALGAGEVVGVCSKKNGELVRSLGADRTIHYDVESIEDHHKGYFDMVFDAASGSGAGENYFKSAKLVLNDPSKLHVTLSGPASFLFQLIFGCLPKHVVLQLTSRKGADLTAVVELLEKTGQRPAIDSVFPFTQKGIDDGFAKLKSRRTKGKLIIDVAATTA